MPKIAHHTGPTMEGADEHVVDGTGQLWQLDPERTVDGDLIEGDHPDRNEDGSRKSDEDDARNADGDKTDSRSEESDTDGSDERRDETGGGLKSAFGNFSTSGESETKSDDKSAGTGPSPVPTMASPSSRGRVDNSSAHSTGTAQSSTKQSTKR
jgi:hypothetical protein